MQTNAPSYVRFRAVQGFKDAKFNFGTRVRATGAVIYGSLWAVIRLQPELDQAAAVKDRCPSALLRVDLRAANFRSRRDQILSLQRVLCGDAGDVPSTSIQNATDFLSKSNIRFSVTRFSTIISIALW
jgi:hypothetical protein